MTPVHCGSVGVISMVELVEMGELSGQIVRIVRSQRSVIEEYGCSGMPSLVFQRHANSVVASMLPHSGAFDTFNNRLRTG